MSSDSLRFAWRVLSLAGLCCAVALATVACDQYRETQLVRSTPVGLMKPESPQALERAIETSLASRGWAVKEHVPQRYVAELHERNHVVTVAIVYNADSARIDYIDSQNLLYQKTGDGEIIHKKYATWIKNLANEIRMNVSRGPMAK
jgi:hypothetical protein